uniref:Uncharacterized protein n=1 Tax=Anguilla anguilla TaxID=7936 RepID=A0A0E9Q9U9_ANGAN
MHLADIYVQRKACTVAPADCLSFSCPLTPLRFFISALGKGPRSAAQNSCCFWDSSPSGFDWGSSGELLSGLISPSVFLLCSAPGILRLSRRAN